MSVTVRSPYWSGTIDIKAQTRFHLKNSFKYTDAFFTSCAESAGYTVMKKWEHHSKPMRLFLLRAASETRQQPGGDVRLGHAAPGDIAA
jgi:uncharacterized SAM-dependent methyltransferase